MTAQGSPSPDVGGKLLVATPLLVDPNFFRSVVYILEHSADGAIGVVLNRATDEPVSVHLPGWAPLLSAPDVVFVGGPVSNEVAVGVVRAPHRPPEDWQPTQHGIGLVDLAGDAAAIAPVSAARVYSGYAGWVAGQLEAELTTGSWIVAAAHPEDVFTEAPDDLWRTVLKRQRDNRSLYASFPDNLRSN